MTEYSERPLVTFGVKCYNQKEYMPSVLRAAFSQTYTPIEIVVVDDGSTDGSGEVIQKMLDEYRKQGGVAFYARNEPNLGNVGTFERLARMAHGELLVQADGDDISLPDRVEKVVRCWLSHDKKPYTIISGAYSMDLQNRIFGELRAREFGVKLPIGASMSWNPKVVTKFSSCINPRACDDGIMVVRAAYFAPIAYVDEPLVCHRVGSGCSTSLLAKDSKRKCIELARQYYDQWKLDLEYMRARCPASKWAEMSRTVEELIEMWEDEARTLAERERNERNILLQLKIVRASIWHLLLAVLPEKFSQRCLRAKVYRSYLRDVKKWNRTIQA